MTDPDQIFLSYAHKDRQIVENIYRDLKRAGLKPWIDDKDILVGEKWLPAIKRAVRESTFFLACMSPNSIKRRGILQREIKAALDVTEELLEDDVFLLPAWIGRRPIPEDDLPQKLSELQWVVLSDSDGWDKLLRSLRKQRDRLGKTESVDSPAPSGAEGVSSEVPRFPADAFVEELREQLAEGDQKAAGSRLAELVENLGWTEEVFPAREANRILRHLRKYCLLQLCRTVAEALLQSGQRSTQIRRQYAESLLDDGAIYGAIEILKDLRSETATDPTENARVNALYGRALTRLYLNAVVKSGERIQGLLKDAVRSYFDVYTSDRDRHLEHGVRAVSLLHRAQRETTDLADFPAPKVLAAEIAAGISDREEFEALKMRDCSAAVEAYLALDKPAEAAEWVQRLVDHPSEDASEIAALYRNLIDLWEVDSSSETGRMLVLPLQRSLLMTAGAPGADEIERALAEEGEAKPQPTLEKVLTRAPNASLKWLEISLVRARAVALISDNFGNPVGTGFLVRGSDLHPKLGEEMILLTAAYVISTEEVRSKLHFQALLPEEARISFTVLSDNRSQPREYGVREVLWSSPVEELDTTLLRLSEPIEGVESYPISKYLPIADGEQRVYIIGHPGGRQLSFSIQDNQLFDHEPPLVHYRAPTEGGSGGSPVFNQEFELIALHHKGAIQMPRLHGKPGTYPASEGIWIQSIIKALSVTLPNQTDAADQNATLSGD